MLGKVATTFARLPDVLGRVANIVARLSDVSGRVAEIFTRLPVSNPFFCIRTYIKKSFRWLSGAETRKRGM